MVNVFTRSNFRKKRIHDLPRDINRHAEHRALRFGDAAHSIAIYCCRQETFGYILARWLAICSMNMEDARERTFPERRSL